MKKGLLLILWLAFGMEGFAQDSPKMRRDRIREIREQLQGDPTKDATWNRAEKIYQEAYRQEVRKSGDSFYEGRDTLYLLVDLRDSLQTYDKNDQKVTWILFKIDWDSPEMENIDCGFGLSIFTDKSFHLKDKPSVRRLLTREQVSALRLVSRAELVAFFNRECARMPRIDEYDSPAWGTWNLKDYFPAVYIVFQRSEVSYEFFQV